jgi:hypothetical protein
MTNGITMLFVLYRTPSGGALFRLTPFPSPLPLTVLCFLALLFFFLFHRCGGRGSPTSMGRFLLDEALVGARRPTHI